MLIIILYKNRGQITFLWSCVSYYLIVDYNVSREIIFPGKHFI